MRQHRDAAGGGFGLSQPGATATYTAQTLLPLHVSGLTGSCPACHAGGPEFESADRLSCVDRLVVMLAAAGSRRPPSEWAVASPGSVDPCSCAGCAGLWGGSFGRSVFAGMGCSVPTNARPAGGPSRLGAAAGSCRLSAKARHSFTVRRGAVAFGAVVAEVAGTPGTTARTRWSSQFLRQSGKGIERREGCQNPHSTLKRGF